MISWILEETEPKLFVLIRRLRFIEDEDCFLSVCPPLPPLVSKVAERSTIAHYFASVPMADPNDLYVWFLLDVFNN